MKDIERFNGQYLKCIVTKYSSAIDNALANSGALIVYHPKSESKINKNYIYLGDEFLASGYGLPTESMQEKATEIVNSYDQTISNLKDKDDKLSERITREVNQLNSKLSSYIKTTGSIDNTTININGKNINTKNMLLYGEEAKYENLEVLDIDVSINGYKIDDNNNVHLPVGSYIKYIDVYVKYKLNDSGGIYQLEALHKNLNNDSLDDEDIESIVIKYDQDSNGDAEIGTIRYRKVFNDDVYITKNIYDVISSFNIYINETPFEKYKDYPNLKSMFGVSIKSISNMVKKNVINIVKNVNIIATYNLFYNTSLSYSTLENSPKTINIINDEVEDIKLNIDQSETVHTLYIAIPSIFKLDKIYGIDANNNKYNWTGLISVLPSLYMLSYNNSVANKNKYYTYYNLFSIYAPNGIDAKEIQISLLKLFDVDSVYIYEDNPITINQNRTEISTQGFSHYTLNDEFFNSLYWVSVSNNNIENINNILNGVSYNAIN